MLLLDLVEFDGSILVDPNNIASWSIIETSLSYVFDGGDEWGMPDDDVEMEEEVMVEDVEDIEDVDDDDLTSSKSISCSRSFNACHSGCILLL